MRAETMKSKVIISLFETVRLSLSISLINLYNQSKSIRETAVYSTSFVPSNVTANCLITSRTSFVKTKIYVKRDDFDFDIVNFPFLDGDVPRSTSYGVYSSQLIRFARVSSHVDDFNTLNKVLTAKLLKQGYRYHKIRKAFSKF